LNQLDSWQEIKALVSGHELKVATLSLNVKVCQSVNAEEVYSSNGFTGRINSAVFWAAPKRWP